MMAKKEILRKWLGEPTIEYGSGSSFVLGHHDGWEWVKETLRPVITKNATFLKALDYSFGQIDAFLKQKDGGKALGGHTLYGVGYEYGVKDATRVIRNRLNKQEV